MSTGRFLALLLLTGCDQAMERQPKLKPFQESSFFADGQASRLPVPGTIARGGLRLDAHLFAGREGQKPAETFPFPIERADLERGRERYDIFCAPCHDRAGTGRGIVVQRGFRAPASFHIDRLREAPPGALFDVITRGFGAMPEYAFQVPPRDRWRIVAYVRALQLSQFAAREDLSPEDLKELR